MRAANQAFDALAAFGRLDGQEATQARREALRRGRLTHLLLQYLPGIAAEHRRDAALAFLAARAAGLDDTRAPKSRR